MAQGGEGSGVGVGFGVGVDLGVGVGTRVGEGVGVGDGVGEATHGPSSGNGARNVIISFVIGGVEDEANETTVPIEANGTIKDKAATPHACIIVDIIHHDDCFIF